MQSRSGSILGRLNRVSVANLQITQDQAHVNTIRDTDNKFLNCVYVTSEV